MKNIGRYVKYNETGLNNNQTRLKNIALKGMSRTALSEIRRLWICVCVGGGGSLPPEPKSPARKEKLKEKGRIAQNPKRKRELGNSGTRNARGAVGDRLSY